MGVAPASGIMDLAAILFCADCRGELDDGLCGFLFRAALRKSTLLCPAGR